MGAVPIDPPGDARILRCVEARMGEPSTFCVPKGFEIESGLVRRPESLNCGVLFELFSRGGSYFSLGMAAGVSFSVWFMELL